jgi:hypothetical protein
MLYNKRSRGTGSAELRLLRFLCWLPVIDCFAKAKEGSEVVLFATPRIKTKPLLSIITIGSHIAANKSSGILGLKKVEADAHCSSWWLVVALRKVSLSSYSLLCRRGMRIACPLHSSYSSRFLVAYHTYCARPAWFAP